MINVNGSLPQGFDLTVVLCQTGAVRKLFSMGRKRINSSLHKSIQSLISNLLFTSLELDKNGREIKSALRYYAHPYGTGIGIKHRLSTLHSALKRFDQFMANNCFGIRLSFLQHFERHDQLSKKCVKPYSMCMVSSPSLSIPLRQFFISLALQVSARFIAHLNGNQDSSHRSDSLHPRRPIHLVSVPWHPEQDDPQTKTYDKEDGGAPSLLEPSQRLETQAYLLIKIHLKELQELIQAQRLPAPRHYVQWGAA
ncbi:hypothetical protein BVH01_16200 [Pseudomonas sp. PA1(2017)]|nr:hypothetical protein BVH01_16200 [Pseudomonas sp. PA1(2017)]